MTKQQGGSHIQKVRGARWQIGVVVGVLALIVVVLALKQPDLSTTSPPGTPDAAPATFADAAEPEAEPTGPNEMAPADGESPHAHLERMLAEGRPIFAFFHSTTCVQCIQMAEIVEEVFPDFVGQVALVDVDVYDPDNQSLLQLAQIRVIPTLIFFDSDGAEQGATGVMPADQLRTVLEALAQGYTP